MRNPFGNDRKTEKRSRPKGIETLPPTKRSATAVTPTPSAGGVLGASSRLRLQPIRSEYEFAQMLKEREAQKNSSATSQQIQNEASSRNSQKPPNRRSTFRYHDPNKQERRIKNASIPSISRGTSVLAPQTAKQFSTEKLAELRSRPLGRLTESTKPSNITSNIAPQHRKPSNSSTMQLLNRKPRKSVSSPKSPRQVKKRQPKRSPKYNTTKKAPIKAIVLSSDEESENSTDSSPDDDLLDQSDYEKGHGDVYDYCEISDLNVEYTVSPNINFAAPHPAIIIESKSLASVKLPELTYKANLPPTCKYHAVTGPQITKLEEINLVELDNNEKEETTPCLSALQVETVNYAGQRHNQQLQSQVRGGYFIADGTGVGKGREVAAIILDNWERNRKKAIWFTASNSLQHDAQRDLTDIGCQSEIPLLSFPTGTKAKIPVSDEGVLFSTYSMLIRSARYQQLINWLVAPVQNSEKSFEELCNEFEGLIVFDEGHCAKNLNLLSDKEAPSKTAQQVNHLQNILPQARVLYVSATPASDPTHMGYMCRLGLWGKGTMFNGVQQFCKQIQESGLSAMELVAMEMKRNGCYCSRHLSYSGTRFEVVEHSLTIIQESMYDNATTFWTTKLIPWCQEEIRNVPAEKRRNLYAQLWSSHQRFFLQFILALKVEKCYEVTQEALRNHQAVVIGLFSTGESALQDLVEDQGCYFPSMFSTARQIMHRLIRAIPQPYISSPDSLVKEIDEMELPLSPLDHLIDLLGGVDNVAEMSGRTSRLVRLDDFHSGFMIERRNTKRDNLEERDAFMDGDKNVAVITAAASVGISLQASKRCKNRKQRVHIILELPWSADKAIQQLGRTHRSHQESCPHYKMIITQLGGEWRLASMVASRVSTLGALTCGERKSGVANHSLSAFELSERFSKLAITNTAQILRRNHSGLFYTELSKLDLFNDNCDYKRFLNRLLGLQIEDQATVFSVFVSCYQEAENQGKILGQTDKTVFDLKAKLFELPQLIDSAGGSIVKLNVVVDRGIAWDEVQKMYEDYCSIDLSDSFDIDNNKDNGFYKGFESPAEILLATKASSNSFHVIFPHLGHQRVNMPRKYLLDHYQKVESSGVEVRELWEQWYDDNANFGKGQRMAVKSVLVGSLFCFFRKFPELKQPGNLQCVRAEVDVSQINVNLLAFPVLSQFDCCSGILKFIGVMLPSKNPSQ